MNLQELLIRWQDGTLTPEESEELARLLENEEARALLVDDFFTIQTLREGLSAAGAVSRPRSRKPLWIAAAAAVIAVGVGAYFFFRLPDAPVALVTHVKGTVLGAETGAIAAGQGLRTVGPASAAEIRFPDGTRMDLGGDTTIDRIDDPGAKQVSISRGTVSAVVRPQTQPMVFTTPHGRATVLGTALRLIVNDRLRLDVETGKVELQNLAGKSVLVEAGHYAVVASGLDLVARRKAPEKAAALVRSMAPDSWLAAPDTRMRRATPDPLQYPKIQLVSGAKSVISSWSGGIYDTRRDRLVVWGGGTSSYAGNEIYAFRLDDLAWERVTDPTPDPTLGRQTNHDGTPAGRSTYNGLAYLAHVDRMFATGGAIADNRGNVGADITWTFDFGTRQWTDLKPAGSRPKTQAMNACAYDPATRKVWWFDGEGLFSYDVDANFWARHTTEGTWDRTVAVDTKRRRLVVIGQGDVLVVDLRAGSPKPQPWKTTGGDAFLKGRPGLDYDPVADRIVGWAGGPVYSLDPDTGAWTARDAPGAPKPTESGIYGRWRYVPSLDVFVVVTDVDENVHFYRASR